MTRSVLVTGATSGIGLATALHLADLGFRTIGSARTPEAADDLAKAAADAGVDLEVVVLDLDDPAAGDEVVPRLDLWGLVNNAGYLNGGAVEDVTIEDARRQLEVMVLAPMRLVQLVLPGMRARGQGRIVNVSSIASRTTGPLMGWYQAVKHALSALTDVLRAEVKSFGVEVVAIEPGAHRTEIWTGTERELEARRHGSAYGEAYERGLQVVRELEDRAPPAEHVAHVIGKALTDGHAAPRYRVGVDTFALDVLNHLVPTSGQDRLTRRVLGL